MADIFLSYAREDIKQAEMLAHALESQGWTVFWDRASLLAGQDFEAVIDQAIRQAGCMVVAWSIASRQSDWVRGEADLGRARNILAPILLAPVEPPIAFRALHTENLSAWQGQTDSPNFVKLCQAIQAILTPKPIPDTHAIKPEIKNEKTSSLKHWYQIIWDWLCVAKHRQTLAFVCGGLAIAIGGGWQGYIQFGKQLEMARLANISSMTATAANGGNAINFVGNNNTIGDPAASANISAIVKTLTEKHKLDSQAKDAQIKALTEAITALSQGQNLPGSKAQVAAALLALANNDTTQAKTLFAQAAQNGEKEAKQAAAAYRHLGALAYLNNTQQALNAYRRATQLDPDNADGWVNFGYLLHRVGDLDQAIAAFNKARKLGEDHYDQIEIAWANDGLGSVYITTGDYDKSIEQKQRSLAIYESLGKKHEMVSVYSSMGYVYELKGNLDNALKIQQKALLISENLDNKEGLSQIYANFGFIYQLRGEWYKSLEYFLKCLAIVEKLGDNEDIAGVYTNLGDVYLELGDLNLALEINQKALAFYKQLGDKEQVADGYGDLADVYLIRGDLEKTTDYYQKALVLHESIGNKLGIVDDYNGFGHVYKAHGDLNKAIGYYQQALILDESLGNKGFIAADYGNLADAYQTQGHPDKALDYHQKALAIYEASGIKSGIADTYNGLGNVYQTRGDLDKAADYHQKALALHESLGSKEGMAKAYNGLGGFYQHKSDLDESIKLNQKALALYQVLGSKEGKATAYSNLGNVYKQKRLKAQAKQAYQKSLDLYKALSNPTKVKQVQDWLDVL